jgi:Tfp pilus assembly protein PilF
VNTSNPQQPGTKGFVLSAPEFFPLRFGFYLVAVALFFQLAMSLIHSRGWEAVAKEGGLLERAQVLLLVGSALGLLVLARRDNASRGLHVVLASFIGFAFIREFNNHTFYMEILPRSWMKSLVACSFAAIILHRYRSTLWPACVRLLQRQSFILYLLGFALVVLWAQVIAQEELLNNRQDRLLEEVLEVAGYFLIFFAVIEEHIAFRNSVVSESKSCFDLIIPTGSASVMAMHHSNRGQNIPLFARSIFQSTIARAMLILLLALVVYTPSVNNGFIWDDDVMLTDNALMTADDGLTRIWFSTELSDYFPLTSTSFWIEWRLWGLNAMGYNITNILLHALGGLLLWRVFLRLKVPGAWIAALLFTVHPVCVASVDWIAERKNTLSMVFYLAALLLYLRFDTNQQRRFYLCALGAFLLALLSKTSVVVLPFVLLLCVWWHRCTIAKRDIIRILPFFALSVCFGLLTVWFQLHEILKGEVEPTQPFLVRVLGGTWALWFYLGKTLLPTKLSMVYSQWNIDDARWISYVPGVLWAAILGIAWRFRQTWGRPVLFGLGYFTIALLPVLGFLHMDFLRFSQVADHLQYIALPGGIALAVGTVITMLRRYQSFTVHPNRLFLVGVIPVLTFSVLTWKQSSLYIDEEVLWRSNIENSPNSWIAYHHLADRLAELRRFEEAAEYYEQALRLEPDFANSHNNFGNCLVILGRFDDAVEQFLDAIQDKPELAEAHHNLGVALSQRKEFPQALDAFKKAIQLRPEYASAYRSAADAELRLGHLDEALDYYFKAAKYNPDSSEIQYNIGIILTARGETNAAVRHLQRALNLQPGDPLIKHELDLLLTSTDPAK